MLVAIANGHSQGLSTRAVMSKYHIESSAAVSAAQKALMNKELIDITDGKTTVSDPIFALWIRRNIQ